MVASADRYDFAADLLNWARGYAAADWSVFPLHSPKRSPRLKCDCPKGDECGNNSAKHPRLEHGLLDATTDEQAIERWWRMWPRANIGVVVPRGYAVLDIDGLEGLDAIHNEGWQIPETVTAATARGWHHWFTTETDLRPGTDFLEHVDLRALGSYVVAPPSLHWTGVQYEWERSPVEVPIAPAPPWLYELVKRKRSRQSHAPQDASDEPIVEGGRNDTLTRLAGYLRRRPEMSERVILAALEALNEERCSPPLDEDEIQTIARSVSRYAPDHPQLYRVDIPDDL